jgi:hypothetical protein
MKNHPAYRELVRRFLGGLHVPPTPKAAVASVATIARPDRIAASWTRCRCGGRPRPATEPCPDCKAPGPCHG